MKLKHKVITSFAILLLGMTALTGCNKTDSIRGKGEIKSFDYVVDDYTKVGLEGGFNVVYSNEKTNIVKMEVQENLAQHIDIDVKDGVLTVKQKKSFSFDNGYGNTLYLATPDLQAVSISGMINFEDSDTIETDTFDLNISGAANVDIPLNVKSLDVDASGVSKISLKGSADNMKIVMSGPGSMDALDLQAKDASVSISGGGTCKVACSDNLDVDISGGGVLEYKGDPTISKEISGIGAVKKFEE